ncbi:hypothetical protein GO755_18125 [Spirosoma sp. HMF4905]|uniref:Uncharacterized protein n=1 Tax=Spirosoma arboris TaxID=2682092 RepID=A0A7K1SDV4_9BACT|nr:hypothetical protein [Spirosoma arboris]MVM31973.1 hypothetical protein [Spirosoma arboris]
MNSINLMPEHSIAPYANEGLNRIYGLLFCDTIDLYKSETKPTGYPWDTLLSDNPDPNELTAITTDNTLETRQQLLAYNLLRAKGFPVHTKALLGVIIEVSLGDGLDVLAAYSDGTCRYINHIESLLVWDTQTEKTNQLVGQLFSDSLNVVKRIGPWDQARTTFPGEGMVKLTFLVSDGLYFGQGPFDVLQNDSMGGPVIDSATRLMTYLIDQRIASNKSTK